MHKCPARSDLQAHLITRDAWHRSRLKCVEAAIDGAFMPHGVHQDEITPEQYLLSFTPITPIQLRQLFPKDISRAFNNLHANVTRRLCNQLPLHIWKVQEGFKLSHLASEKMLGGKVER